MTSTQLKIFACQLKEKGKKFCLKAKGLCWKLVEEIISDKGFLLKFFYPLKKIFLSSAQCAIKVVRIVVVPYTGLKTLVVWNKICSFKTPK